MLVIVACRCEVIETCLDVGAIAGADDQTTVKHELSPKLALNWIVI
jgi:hypothetical protein